MIPDTGEPPVPLCRCRVDRTGTYKPTSLYSASSEPPGPASRYDGHGNMVATLARDGNNSFTLGGLRSFDAWGSVRSGSGGDPTGRYCASIGHKQDDESGLIYMRARYYEPTSGRFVSQDPGRQGTNRFAYCNNNPSLWDASGKSWTSVFSFFFLITGTAMCILAAAFAACALTPADIVAVTTIALAAIGALAIGLAFMMRDCGGGNWVLGVSTAALAAVLTESFARLMVINVAEEVSGAAIGGKTPAANAAIKLLAYSLLCWSYIFSTDLENAGS